MGHKQKFSLVKRPSSGPARTLAKENRNEQIELAEQELYEQNLNLLRDASHFADTDPSDQAVPREWVRQLGAEGAAKRARMCRAAWLPSKEAPSGLTIAKYVVGSFAKARADGKRPASLNVTLIQMVGPPREFPSIEVIESDGK